MMKELIILLTLAAVVCLVSWLVFKVLTEKGVRRNSSYLYVTVFWLLTDLSLVIALLYAELYDFNFYRYPDTVCTLQYLFLASFIAGMVCLLRGLDYFNLKKNLEL